ncbi:hypothetical protein [Rhodanobacter sp. DHG33]|uniref:hypothetical protein n=1 Tax=Rhodanobacter sp. DHG33 TaxID=2775921 RepID=UPI001786156B|nr:hypothetical protein [Rhodanobacter sp. DHG33]MBD8898572.1 hypothetical protein [Rhodanobacter sp. DHG33]
MYKQQPDPKSAPMKSTKESQEFPTDQLEIIYTGAPKTHIFYEYEGERPVDPLQMVRDGGLLWWEQAQNNLEHSREVHRLWNEAEALLSQRQETLTHSYVEWLRYRVIIGALDPTKSFKQKKPYAYRGMLISAIYLQEAERLCAEGDTGRVWHLIATAYYHLGMNTTPSTTELTARAAKKKHEDSVGLRRAIVLVTLEIIGEQQKKKQTIRTIEDAKDEVIKLIYSNKAVLADLEQLDAKTLNRKAGSDALDRFRGLLDAWASPNGPHPDIAEAFSIYDQKKRAPKREDTSRKVWASAVDPGVTRYMRLVHYMEHGGPMEVEIMRKEEASQGEPAE